VCPLDARPDVFHSIIHYQIGNLMSIFLIIFISPLFVLSFLPHRIHCTTWSRCDLFLLLHSFICFREVSCLSFPSMVVLFTVTVTAIPQCTLTGLSSLSLKYYLPFYFWSLLRHRERERKRECAMTPWWMDGNCTLQFPYMVRGVKVYSPTPIRTLFPISVTHWI